jgi:hypothetical protein
MAAQVKELNTAEESRDETIVVRLNSGDRYRFEDENGAELCMVEIGLEEDPQSMAVYLYGKGKVLSYSTVMK